MGICVKFQLGICWKVKESDKHTNETFDLQSKGRKTWEKRGMFKDVFLAERWKVCVQTLKYCFLFNYRYLRSDSEKFCFDSAGLLTTILLFVLFTVWGRERLGAVYGDGRQGLTFVKPRQRILKLIVPCLWNATGKNLLLPPPRPSNRS